MVELFVIVYKYPPFSGACELFVKYEKVCASKEVYDMTHDGHDAEWADFVADIIGAVAGEIAVLILHG